VANRPNARFCANCGTAFEAPDKNPPPAGPDTSGAQQKQVTILFADICGSTELISRMDAEDASYTLGSVISVISKAVTRFGGVVIRRMGDGVMVLFGAPIATEDHAARAASPPSRRSMPSVEWAISPCRYVSAYAVGRSSCARRGVTTKTTMSRASPPT